MRHFQSILQWLRDGRRVPVSVPPGCLIIQAGKQLEWLTGGEILAGFHEVVVTQDTRQAVERARAEGRPLWRVSSTVFTHVASAKVEAEGDCNGGYFCNISPFSLGLISCRVPCRSSHLWAGSPPLILALPIRPPRQGIMSR